MPVLICLREKLWTRTYSTRDQVPTFPVFTRAKIKPHFGDKSKFFASHKHCFFSCPAGLQSFIKSTDNNHWPPTLLTQHWLKSSMLKASHSWSHFSSSHVPLWTSCATQKRVHNMVLSLYTWSLSRAHDRIFFNWTKISGVHHSFLNSHMNYLKKRRKYVKKMQINLRLQLYTPKISC